MGNAEKIQLLVVKGAISELPNERQVRIAECKSKLESIIAEYGEDDGYLALALYGAELSERA